MFARLRFRFSELVAGYRWLWRAARRSTPSGPLGIARFLAYVTQDLIGIVAWSASIPLRHPAQRDRVVIPGLLVASVVLVSLNASQDLRPTSPGIDTMSQEIGEACGGAIYLGAVAAPGDHVVEYAACSDAVAEAPICAECDSEPMWGSPTPARVQLTI